MKEFFETLKQYKEFVLTIVALVSGSIFIMNYFATKDALEKSQQTINALIAERECQLGNRITSTSANAAIGRLERERLERLRERLGSERRLKKPNNATDREEAEELVEKSKAELERIDAELKEERARAKQADHFLSTNACAGNLKQKG